ncbi:hypothetical protein [Oricola indica]|uniref:hypothetical protein n=1 Tax=Oricola indica TaxID=2872591 RepID=UPI003CCBEA88
MNTIKALLAASLLAATVGPVFAQQECTCKIPLTDGSKEIGEIADGAGDVRAIDFSGALSGAKAGQPLFLGSRVVTGTDGTAQISIFPTNDTADNGCQFTMDVNSEMSIFASDTEICVAAYQSQPASTTASGGNGQAAAALLILGTVGGVTAIVVSGGDKKTSAQ